MQHHTTLAIMLGSCLLALSVDSHALQQLSDSELAEQSGQALVGVSYLAPGDTGNNQASTGFYTLAINAQVNINANIKSLKLGCGGTNGAGAGGCDIDIDNMALSGNPGTNGCASGAVRADCDATITNPFIRFAIKNPTSASTREISGIQFGAKSILGLLTTGLANSTTPNGINTLSGYLKAQSVAGSPDLTGKISTNAEYMDVGTYPISGALDATLLGLGLAHATFHTVGGGFWLPGMNNINFTIPNGALVNQNRTTALTVHTDVSLPTIVLGHTPDSNTCGGFASGTCNNYGTPANGFQVKPQGIDESTEVARTI